VYVPLAKAGAENTISEADWTVTLIALTPPTVTPSTVVKFDPESTTLFVIVVAIPSSGVAETIPGAAKYVYSTVLLLDPKCVVTVTPTLPAASFGGVAVNLKALTTDTVDADVLPNVTETGVRYVTNVDPRIVTCGFVAVALPTDGVTLDTDGVPS
jgi:hypothetical protein